MQTTRSALLEQKSIKLTRLAESSYMLMRSSRYLTAETVVRREELVQLVIGDKDMAEIAAKNYDIASTLDKNHRPIIFTAVEHHREAAVAALSSQDERIVQIRDEDSKYTVREHINNLYTLELKRRF